MKTITTIYVLACFPLFIAAQGDDYCPCMETENNLDLLMESLRMPEYEASVVVTPPTKTSYTFVMQETQPELPTEEVTPAPEPPAAQKEEADAPAEKEEVIHNYPVKEHKPPKGRRVRLKKRKKRKKYRGGCPWF